MRYIIAALLLSSGLASVHAQERVNVSSAPFQGVGVSTVAADGIRTIDPREYDTPEMNELQMQINQDSQEFGAKQMEERRAFLKDISSKSPKEQRKLYNTFQRDQVTESSRFNKERRVKTYRLGLMRHKARLHKQSEAMSSFHMSDDAKKAYLEQMDVRMRETLDFQYKRMEEDEAELDKVRSDFSIKPEKRRKKLEELSKKLMEKHDKEDKANNEKRAKQVEEQMRKERAQQMQVRQSTATVRQ